MPCVLVNISRTGCANVQVRGNERLSLGASLSRPDVNVSKDDSPTLDVAKKNSVAFTASATCTFTNGVVLIVSPDVVWLNESNDYRTEFNVISNVDWEVE